MYSTWDFNIKYIWLRWSDFLFSKAYCKPQFDWYVKLGWILVQIQSPQYVNSNAYFSKNFIKERTNWINQNHG